MRLRYIKNGLIALFVLVNGAQATTQTDGHGDHDHSVKIGEPGKPGEVTRTISVLLHDIYYDPPSISIKSGETIRFAVHNVGQLVHELSIATPAMHADHKNHMLVMMQTGILMPNRINHDKMADSGMAHSEPNTVLLEPDEHGEIVWKFSDSVELEFACTVPGHYESGMVGNFEWQ